MELNVVDKSHTAYYKYYTAMTTANKRIIIHMLFYDKNDKNPKFTWTVSHLDQIMI